MDPLSRHTSIQSPHFTQEIIQFDPVGNIRKMRIQEDLLTYAYDDLYQLASETGHFSHNYTYDSLNNRLQKDTEIYQINDLNQISSHFKYDLDGNLIHDGNASYTYDALGRLIGIKTSEQIQIFSYDSLHRCFNKKTIKDGSESVQCFIYDEQKEIGSYDAELVPFELRILGSTPLAEIGASIAVELNQIPYTPIHDLQGNLAALIPFSNNNPTHYRYSAFGEERIDGLIISPWSFSSKRTDRTTKLINFGRRYYIPHLGRWLTPDPAGFSDGMNLYAYVHNDPLTHFDEYGLWEMAYSSRWTQVPLGVMTNPYKSSTQYKEPEFDFRTAGGSRILPSLNPNPKYSNHYYVNGIQNTLEDNRAGARTLLNTYQGKANIIPAYSTTFGKKYDLTSVYKSKNDPNYSTDFIKQFSREIQLNILCMEAMQDPRKIFITCFSRGSTDVYHACKNLSLEHKKRLIITACGPIMILPRDLGFIVKNLVSVGDWYSFRCNPGLEDNPENYHKYANVRILPQKDGFSGFNKDHFFKSMTYQDGIQDHCVADYRDYGEIK